MRLIKLLQINWFRFVWDANKDPLFPANFASLKIGVDKAHLKLVIQNTIPARRHASATFGI